MQRIEEGNETKAVFVDNNDHFDTLCIHHDLHYDHLSRKSYYLLSNK